MQVSYSADVEQIDQMVRDIAASREEGDVAIRLQPTLLYSGNYVAWQGVSWRVTAANPEEAFALRDAIQALLQGCARHGAVEMQARVAAVAA